MCKFVQKVLSRDAGLFWQVVKYGCIGVLSTIVQTGVFYALATSCLKCLTTGDVAVKLLGFAAAEGLSDSDRALRFALATAIGFILANVVCWLLNRRFVFTPGRYSRVVEFLFFFGVSSVATLIALGASSALIRWMGLMTSIAVVLEVVISFVINFFVRKFAIFRR